MIMPSNQSKREASPEPHTHTLSPAFLNAMRTAALKINQSQDGWKELVKHALDVEFPDDAEMRDFAEASFSRIIGFLIKGKEAIHIHRSVNHGLELFVGDE